MIDILSGIVILFFSLYVLFVMYSVLVKIKDDLVKQSLKTLIVIGSGGHTQEMIKHLSTLNPELYGPRLYVMADMDTSSEYKIRELEAKFGSSLNSDFEIVKIPRSRSVHQSYITSVFTTLYSTLVSLPVFLKFQPDLILCNGPGTCIPICLIAFLYNNFCFAKVKIIFIESICRVKTLSMSGKILLYFADVVIVQWETLHKKYPKTVFLGRLI